MNYKYKGDYYFLLRVDDEYIPETPGSIEFIGLLKGDVICSKIHNYISNKLNGLNLLTQLDWSLEEIISLFEETSEEIRISIKDTHPDFTTNSYDYFENILIQLDRDRKLNILLK